MAPNAVTSTVTCEVPKLPVKKVYKKEIVWRNVILFIYLHAAALFGLYLMLFVAQWNTLLFGKCKIAKFCSSIIINK